MQNKRIIYKGTNLYHVGDFTLRAGVNYVTDAQLAYCLANPYFRDRVNLGIIDLPDVPKPTGKDLNKSIDDTIAVVSRMNEHKVLQSIARYDSRREVAEAAEKRLEAIKKRFEAGDISNKHFQTGS